ncbi:MAG: ParA family protein [Nitrospinota bacterium]
MSIALGAYFGRSGSRALLIDLDPQGHVAPGLGLDLAYDDNSIADVLMDGAPLSSIISPTSIDGFDIAPSNIKLSMVNETLYNTFQREKKLQKALAATVEKKEYQYIILDCPPSLGPLVENALTIADLCLIPCEPSSRSIDGLADFTKKISEVRDGKLDDHWYIILSRVKRSARITNEVIGEKLNGYKSKILNTRIYEKEVINQAQIAGIPIFQFPKGNPAAETFSLLGEEVENRCQAV